MQKIIALSFVAVLATLSGCADPCVAASDRQTAKLESCGFEAPSEGEGEGEGEAAECTEDDQKTAECNADCYEAADCEGVPGADDYDATSDAATSFNECIADCNA
ncbi:MAG TPA: hypothetical protein VGF99_11070 [Myxococcota bacterium]